MTAGQHSERAHALLSASGAYRWMACTPSARLEEKFPEDKDASIYAQEGTFAHELSELEIKFSLDKINDLQYHKEKSEKIASEFFTDEMEEETEKYVLHVVGAATEAIKADRFAEIIIEDRFDLTRWIPEGFGSNDAVIIAGDTLKVIDLKYGKGIKVKADHNPQLMLYALGALEKHGILFGIERVEMTIVQPRLNSISTWEISADELLKWGEEIVKPTAAKAFKGEGEFKPGDHCQFCKASIRCKALAQHNLELVKYEFRDPDLLEDEELLEVFDKGPALIKWANKIEAYVLEEAIKGKVWPGYKMVEGRSVRQITDEEKAAAALYAAGFEDAKIYTRKLKGITDLTKLLGKTEFEAVLGPYVHKPAGKPTLAPNDDPRPEIAQSHKEYFD